MYGNEQVGWASFSDGTSHAILWRGTAAAWVDLMPQYAVHSTAWGVHDGRQVGTATFGPVVHAALWYGTAASFVDLHPYFATESEARGVWNDEQVGWAVVQGVQRASLWRGTAASWTDLSPPDCPYSLAWGVHEGEQVGLVSVMGRWHASLWRGTAESRLDLHQFLPPYYTDSWAFGIWHEGGQTFVSGWAWYYDEMEERDYMHAYLWKFQAPVNPCPGDADCDGDIDFFDIDPFVAKLGCPGADPQGCGSGCTWQNCDVDGDGDVDFFDIDPFVALLGTTCP